MFFIKLPENHCIRVDYDDDTSSLYEISVTETSYPLYVYGDGKPTGTAIPDNAALLSDHYTKGFYNDDHLVLCNESEEGLSYISYCFETKEIENHSEVEALYERFGFEADQWILFCSPSEQDN